MTSADWQRVKEVLNEALQVDDSRRERFIREACGADSAVADEVRSLLEAEKHLGEFIEKPAFLSIMKAAYAEGEELAAGQKLGRYEIVRDLGRGGMGAVYLAFDSELGRRVALKILPSGLCDDDEACRRFAREAKVVSALNHPNVLTIHEIGRIDSIAFIATEFVDGKTLRQMLSEEGRIAPPNVVAIGAQIAAALAEAHAAGFIHRDIKPDNIMVRRDGLVKVLDFGIARAARESQMLEPPISSNSLHSFAAGTPRYMAPELAKGNSADERSDIWSFGAVLREMLTGGLPDRTADAASTGSRAYGELERLIAKCLHDDPAMRFQSAGEVLERLNALRESTTANEKANYRRYTLSAAALLLIAATAAAYAIFYRGSAAPAPVISNIAVLPAQAVGTEHGGQQYFADGLTDGLIADLSQIGDLRVISRTSVMRYKNMLPPLAEISESLNVQGVVIPTFQLSGETVRLSAKLISAASGAVLWEKSYEAPVSRMPQIHEEIAREISKRLHIDISAEESARLNDSTPVVPAAYENYLQGRFFLNQRNEESLRAAISRFEASIASDPGFAPAHAFLAEAWFALGTEIVAAIPPHEALDKAKPEADAAVALDPTLADAHMMRGVVALYSWDWAAANESLERAIQINPNLGAARSWHALYSASQGRVGEAIARMYRARDLDPLSPHINQNVGWMLNYAGQYREEIEQYNRALELDPGFLFARRRLVGAYLRAGMPDAAKAESERIIALSGRKPMSIAPLAMVLARTNRKPEAAKLMRELLEAKNSRHVSSYTLANLYLALGDEEQAFAQLEKAYRDHSYALVFLKVTTDFNDDFRRDPRFISILRRLNLS